ncbi:MAG: ABC transporter substrate-binding protein [Pseudomonadota bacterium]
MSRYLITVAAVALIAGAATAQTRTDIRVGMQLEPPSLDPTGEAAAAVDEVLYANVMEGLTRFAADGSVQPGLASTWSVSDNGLEYTFLLRDGVTFHDGTSFEASDVVFSLDRARAEDSTNAQKALFAGIESVEALNELVVRVTLSSPNGNFPFNLAWGDAVIVAPESVESIATNPIGTGPFTFTEWRQGDSVILTRNPDYWGTPVALEEATFKFISDPTAALAAMLTGDLDAFPTFPAPENLAQFEADPRFRVIVGSTEGETILSTNNTMPPLDDVRVRKAIAHAIDRQAIVDGAMFGYGTPIGTHFAPHNPAYIDLTGLSNHDPALSRELLAEAGYPEGFTTTLKLPPPSYARRGGEIIAAQLREVGIEVEISNLEWAQWLEQVFRGGDYGLTIVSHTEPFDIGIYARDDYYFNYVSEEMAQIIDDLTLATDPAERVALMQVAQEHIARDYVNGYLFQLAKTGVADARIEGLWENAPAQANDLTGVRWSE